MADDLFPPRPPENGSVNDGYAPIFKHEVNLVDEAQYTWKVQYEGFYSAKQRHYRLTTGWTAFIKMKRVVVGDTVVIDRWTEDRLNFVIHIIRSSMAIPASISPSGGSSAPTERRARQIAAPPITGGSAHSAGGVTAEKTPTPSRGDTGSGRGHSVSQVSGPQLSGPHEVPLQVSHAGPPPSAPEGAMPEEAMREEARLADPHFQSASTSSVGQAPTPAEGQQSPAEEEAATIDMPTGESNSPIKPPDLEADGAAPTAPP
eukprot:jgi/Botrbrau1/9199/Bobra.0236s0026.1